MMEKSFVPAATLKVKGAAVTLVPLYDMDTITRPDPAGPIMSRVNAAPMTPVKSSLPVVLTARVHGIIFRSSLYWNCLSTGLHRPSIAKTQGADEGGQAFPCLRPCRSGHSQSRFPKLYPKKRSNDHSAPPSTMATTATPVRAIAMTQPP